MDVLQKALECKDGGRGKQFPPSKHHPAKTSNSVVQLRLLAHIWWRWFGWLHWVVQCSFHYTSPADAVRLVYLCHRHSGSPLPKGPSWQNVPPTWIIPPAAAAECLLLPGITRHMRSESPTGDGSWWNLQWTALFFNKLNISLVRVQRRYFYACIQIVGVTFWEFIF